MSRKVLGAGGHAAFLQAGHDDRAEPSHGVRIRRERPVPDHGVRGLVEEIEDRREVEGHPDRRQLRRQGLREAARQVFAPPPPEMHHGRPLGERRPQAGDPPSLLVDPDPQGGLPREPPGGEGQLRDLLRRLDVAGEQHHPAEVPLPRERAELDRHRASTEPGHHHLPHLTMQRTHDRPFLSNREGCAWRAPRLRLGTATGPSASVSGLARRERSLVTTGLPRPQAWPGGNRSRRRRLPGAGGMHRRSNAAGTVATGCQGADSWLQQRDLRPGAAGGDGRADRPTGGRHPAIIMPRCKCARRPPPA